MAQHKLDEFSNPNESQRPTAASTIAKNSVPLKTCSKTLFREFSLIADKMTTRFASHHDLYSSLGLVSTSSMKRPGRNDRYCYD